MRSLKLASLLLLGALLLCGCSSTRPAPKVTELSKGSFDASDVGLGIEPDNSGNKTKVILTFFVPSFEYGKDAITVPDKAITVSFGSDLLLEKNIVLDAAVLNEMATALKKVSDTNYQIQVPLDEIKLGNDNTLVLIMSSKSDLAGMSPRDFYFRVGEFYPFINVTAQTTKLENDVFNVNFVILNKGKPKTIPTISFRCWSNFADQLEIRETTPEIELMSNNMGSTHSFSDVYANPDESRTITYRIKIKNPKAIFNTDKFRREGLIAYPSYFYTNQSENKLPPIVVANISIFSDSCKTNADCLGSEMCLTETCVTPKMNIIFVPVNWQQKNLSGFNDEVDEQAKFLLDSWPSLEGCRNKVKITKLNQSLFFKVASGGSPFDLMYIRDYARQMTGFSDINFIIGISEKNEFIRSILEPSILGYSYPEPKGDTTNALYVEDTVFITSMHPKNIAPGSPSFVVSHEIGHLLRLNDQYCYQPNKDPFCGGEPNPISKEEGCDPNFSDGCCWTDLGLIDMCQYYWDRNVTICCNGNKNKLRGRSIMSHGGAAGPHYFDEPSLKYLARKAKLQCNESGG